MDLVFCFSQVDLLMPIAGAGLLICSWLIRDTVRRYGGAMPAIQEYGPLLLVGARVVSLSGVAVLLIWFAITFVEPFLTQPQC